MGTPQGALRITGFTKTSSLIYFLLTTGVFAVFCISELRWLNYGNREEGGWWLEWRGARTVGEAYWFREPTMKLGIQLHLWSVIPAGILLPLQFLPIMRRKYMYLHKISGKFLFVALMMGNITAIKIGPRSFGGSFDLQCFVWALSTAITVSIYKAWSGIRNLHIDQHRVWVIRCWAYACSILSLRIWMTPLILSILRFAPNRYHFVKSCSEIAFLYTTRAPEEMALMLTRFPACANLTAGVDTSTYVAVLAGMDARYPEQKAAMFNLVFCSSGVLGFLLNAALAEVYLNYTTDEDERLKKVSVARRKAAGLVPKEPKASSNGT
ncbi:uncharacterized protein BP5553_08747 [Venustampulla echinocandica]|uniref:Uncharacterized protein n=1 Tax=Venustampulla echinocandica TaxID=2656787 RepID=A0A370TF40_9HELO|nr:uncharacterized protein BP5553_08747 [Venustampulla echinocandica]RDL33308.1 hypothetical protein BP5553_08747 [Venustampulla echinocandica]